MDFIKETQRRRTFAIISHPDAGKTTITEKILFQGGVIREAGEVKGKSGTKAATSDWMTMEQERGVSITSSVMQFDFRGLRVNLLDTPGHKDFGEDTYRTLIAADCAAMLIDSAKGVEKQTRKLYEVCKLKKMPIFTFANKMDREGKEALEIVDDVESTLGIKCYPVTWPIGMGDLFAGLYHRLENKVYHYTKGTVEPEIFDVTGWQDEKIKAICREDFIYDRFLEEMELLEIAIDPFSKEEFLAGKVSPMSFGSAKFNWGVDIFLEMFADFAPEPLARHNREGELIEPQSKKFSGFVFKIQANMDRKHRDRVAFVRVCSGQFERGMKVLHVRLKRDLRLSYATQFMAQDRETVEQAFPGDIVGVTDTGNFQIGDTITSGQKFMYPDMPRFSPEVFAKLSIKDPLKRKQMQKAVLQLGEEGTVQIFFDPFVGIQDPVIGVVGELQFDVLLYRLNDEYGLEVKLDKQPYTVARWANKIDGSPVGKAINGGTLYRDMAENPVVLLNREWDLRWLEKENPELEFKSTAGL